MSIFNISDITPTGALYNAMTAARESDRRAARHQFSAAFESAQVVHTAPTPRSAIREAIGDALHHFSRAGRTETV